MTNNQIRDIVTRQAVTMRQTIYSATVFPPSNNTISLNTAVRNVGIIKRFVVEIVATLTNNSGATATLTDFGLSNLISNVTLYDFNNNLRINTDGKHLTMVSGAKRKTPFGACGRWNDSAASGTNISSMLNVPVASWGVFQAPQTIAASASATVRAVFEIPVAYSDHDLRGAIYAGIVNSQMNPIITLNANAFTNGADTTNAVYSGNAGVFTSAAVTVTQEYLDQIPSQGGKLLLPPTDLSTVYELKNTTFQSITPNRDFPIPFTNFRSFLSAIMIWNNNGGNGRAFGTDVNYWSRQTANFTNIFQYDPFYNALLTREIIGSELPAGAYLFSFRQQPIITTQYGNQQLNLNASTASAGNYIIAYWEDMALQNTLQGSASLPG
jgi:hypothetical protein